MKKTLIALSLLLGANAFASGGFSCNGDDKDATFTFGTATGRMFGSPIVNATGNLEFKKAKEKRDIRTAEFSKDSVVNYWTEESGETKVALYFEGGTDDFFGEVQVTLKFKPDPKAKDESEAAGTVKIKKIVNSAEGTSTTSEYDLKVKCLTE